MKKLLSILLVLCMLVSMFMLASCEDTSNTNNDDDDKGKTEEKDKGDGDKDKGDGDKKEEAFYDIFTAAAKKTDEAKTSEVKMTNVQKTNLMGTTSETTTTGTAQYNMTNKDKPIVNMDAKVSTSGFSMDMKIYYDGEYMYVNAMGMGYKQKVSVDEVKESSGGSFNISLLPKELFEGVKATKNADGTTTATVTITNEVFKTTYKDVLVDLFADVISGEDLTNVTVKDAKVDLTIADGYVTKYTVNYTAEYAIGNDKVSHEITEQMEFYNFDKDITITPMEGYKDFPEMDEG